MIKRNAGRKVMAAHMRLLLQCKALLLVACCLLAINSFAQQPIKGKVRDSTQALPGVTIQVKGSNARSVTNDNGEFSIVAAPNSVLVFSFVGFQSKEVPVNSRTSFDVELSPSQNELDQVVVTGYTRQAKKDITGAVSVVDVNALKSIPTGTAEQALQGQAAGVSVVTSGAPGGQSNIFIRGISSFGNTA
ncbi:MAG TPA: carboxypeptidase-like regulatory domain-containing protein, partial [Chryseolinea sp.]|nr:carboxypeptidase-like regulatory domain-containing protein [Chryseolinea sp.]